MKFKTSIGSSPASSSGDVSGTELDEEITWIEWFCHLKGHEFFCEVDDDYIQDDFNLTGLTQQVPYYDKALNLILDCEEDQDEPISEAQAPIVENAAQMLYGLIHQRYILTVKGMQAMLDKYERHVFSTCPNAYCDSQNQAVLPSGPSDQLRVGKATVYCPRCQEIYFPKSARLEQLDGAYFGPSFPHLFFLTYTHLVPSDQPTLYVPKIFGFKLHRSVKDHLRKLRAERDSQEDNEEKKRKHLETGSQEDRQSSLMARKSLSPSGTR